MERIFKIKTKTDKAPQSQYPSERRYSASIVIGLGVVFLQLGFYSVLMGTLIVHKLTIQDTSNITIDQDETDLYTGTLIRNISSTQVSNIGAAKIETELYIILKNNSKTDNNLPILMCSSCYLMALGYLLGFIAGVLAWKHWYIDHNITFFFVACTFSSITSLVGLMLSLITSLNLNFDYDTYIYKADYYSPVTFSLAMNIIILSSVGTIWSILATKVAYVGMKSSYPDDIVLDKRGRHVEVSTVKMGNKNSTVFPPDIIEHFPSGDKLAKYLPKKENDNLPKAESTLEYRQRVDRFLSEVPEAVAEDDKPTA